MALRHRLMGLVSAIALTSCQELAPLFEPSYEFQLAEHLASNGASFYGAYWCPHCARQKQIFGDAAYLLPYVECDHRGVNAQVDRCAGVSAYPTWEINGGFYLGVQSITQLAQLSGYQLPDDFSHGESEGWGSFSPAQ